MQPVDIRPFALPNTPANEIRFEDPRDINKAVVTFKGNAPDSAEIYYLQKTWPGIRLELINPTGEEHAVGWTGIDDWFNSQWKKAAINVKKISGNTLEITFKGLGSEYEDRKDYDVAFRRTLGLKIDGVEPERIEKVEVYTNSEPKVSEIKVLFDAGKKTPGSKLSVSPFNAVIEDISPSEISLQFVKERVLKMKIRHLIPNHHYSYDEGMITFELDHDKFTISLKSLSEKGPIWYEEEGVFITFADDPTTFDDYLKQNSGRKTTSQKVLEHVEQSYGGAYNGQPRPHLTPCSVGCKHARQKFWLEPNGDVIMHRHNLEWITGPDTQRFKNEGHGRLLFGLERWQPAAHFFDPAPIMAYNVHLMKDDIKLELKHFAVPLEKSIFDDPAGDDTIICMSRFVFTNLGDDPAEVELPIGYSDKSSRSHNRLDARGSHYDDRLISISEREKLSIKDLGTMDSSGKPLTGINGDWQGQQVLRAVFASDAEVSEDNGNVVLRKELAPNEQLEVLMKIPYIALDQDKEIKALAALDFNKAYSDVVRFWRDEVKKGAQLKTAEPSLDALYKSHLAHVEISDCLMPGHPELVNTSVGTSTYGNFTNESVMIVEELEERGLQEEVRKRLNVWMHYQGTKGLNGRFTDHDGVFYGAGGYEMGFSYCQHHGWVLWYLSKHYLMTRDDEWFKGAVDHLLKGVDWVARQRRETKKEMPFSRGWEYGWMPAGGLEDVDDYFYWLSTNSLTWRGMEWAARALEAAGHPEAARVRAEADDYGKCLRNGFETMRQHSPLVRLKDGRWVPHYPVRLYRRGRDMGWIREVLEGPVYLLISGLYDANSKQASWILDDYLDNKYLTPEFFYLVYQPERHWFDYGGFSNQPNLLAGLMPHLDRDEPEIYIWMFYNAWMACYRDEINAMVEHPQPILGFSNSAIYKPSDQANSIKWLRYMYVYAKDDLLHLGRAIPRDWFSDGRQIYAQRVFTKFGEVSVEYTSTASSGSIKAEVDFSEKARPGKMLVRFRHPDKLPVKSVQVNGKTHDKFDPIVGDVDITGMTGRVEVVAAY